MSFFKAFGFLNLFLLLHVEFLVSRVALFVSMEVRGELDLSPDLLEVSVEHRVSEANADHVDATLISLILVLVIWPNDAIIDLLTTSIVFVDLQLEAVNLLLQVLLVVIDDARV